MPRTPALLVGALSLAALLACGGGGGDGTTDPTKPPPSYVPTDPTTGPAAGWSGGNSPIPDEALAEDVSHPDHVVGTGTPASCTAADFIAKVALGGKITFNCGPNPVTIKLTSPAKIHNDKPTAANAYVVIDGGGLVTLSGSGVTRILYMDVCDQSLVWTTSHCQNQETPSLTVQNLTFIDGSAVANDKPHHHGGGAIYVAGGRFKIVNCRFFNNKVSNTGNDIAGGAVYVFGQYNALPVYVVHSTFGGASGYGNSASSGGALGSIMVSWSIYNSVLSYNKAVGGTSDGGGGGGAIYNDGNSMTLGIYGSLLEHNDSRTFAAHTFFVANDGVGTVRIHDSTLQENTVAKPGWQVATCPGLSFQGSGTDFSNNVNCR